MKNIEQIKQELINFGKKRKAHQQILNSIKGDTLTELFGSMDKHIRWYKRTPELFDGMDEYISRSKGNNKKQKSLIPSLMMN